MEELIEIGWMGRAHGLKGEIKVHVGEFFEDDLLQADSVHIGDPAVPYFLEYTRGGGAIIIKIEELDTREQISLLSKRPLFLMRRQTTEREPEPDTPFDALIGYSIDAAIYPRLGPITGIMDLPSHHLAELSYEGRDVLIPLHEELIKSVDEEAQILRMDLPAGLLD